MASYPDATVSRRKGVVRRGAMLTWRSAGKAQLGHDTNDVHVSEAPCVHTKSTRCRKQEDEGGTHKGQGKVEYAIG
jgi:hypothetical protein